jgi:hypothetical protein
MAQAAKSVRCPAESGQISSGFHSLHIIRFDASSFAHPVGGFEQ